MNELLRSTVDMLQGLRPDVLVFVISALPIFEIRGGVIVGLAFSDMPISHVLLWGFLGNIASVTPVLLFLEPLSRWLHGNRIADRFFHWLFARARRHAERVNRWGPLGLLVFTAIPLPGSGAWTATLVAIVLGMRRGRAIVPIYLGVLVAGVVVSLLVLGAGAGLRHIFGV